MHRALDFVDAVGRVLLHAWATGLLLHNPFLCVRVPQAARLYQTLPIVLAAFFQIAMWLNVVKAGRPTHCEAVLVASTAHSCARFWPLPSVLVDFCPRQTTAASRIVSHAFLRLMQRPASINGDVAIVLKTEQGQAPTVSMTARRQ